MSQQTLEPEQLTGAIGLLETSKASKRTAKKPFSLVRLGVYAIIFVLVVIYLFPVLYLFNVSLKTNNEFIDDPTGISKTFQFSNYTEAWVKGNFTTQMLNTIYYTVASTVFQVVFSLLATYPIARGYVRWGGFFATFFVISLFLPNGLIPQFQLMLALGLYNTQIGYILLSSAVGIGPFLIIGYLKTIPKELDEAAAIDGCGYFRCIFTIIAPLAKPALVTVAILHAIGVWNDIIGPIIYLTDRNYYPISRGLLAFRGQFSSDWTLLAAGTMIAVLPLLLLYLFLQKYFIEGAVAGAVK